MKRRQGISYTINYSILKYIKGAMVKILKQKNLPNKIWR